MKAAIALLMLVTLGVLAAACGPTPLPSLFATPTAIQPPAATATTVATVAPAATAAATSSALIETRAPATATASAAATTAVTPAGPGAATATAAPTQAMPMTPAGQASVSGTITYLERIALSPDAIIGIFLLDVTRADAPATVVATRTIQAGGKQPPIPFEIQYDAGKIDARHSYVLQARIVADNKLQFVNTQPYPVITQGNPVRDVKIVVRPVPSAPATTSMAPDLMEVAWKWQKYADQAGKNEVLVPQPENYLLELLPEGRFRFRADCNNGYGTFAIEAESLRLQPGPMTKMACPGQSLGNQYLRLLGEVTKYAFDQGNLVLGLKGDAGYMVFTR